MADEDYLIDVDLDDVDDSTTPLPDGRMVVRVASVQKKQKEGSAYPYFEITFNPVETEIANRKLWTNITTHPKGLFNMKRFAAATGLSSKKPNMQEAVGKTLAIYTKIVPGFKDPERKVNEVQAKYEAVA